MSALGQLQLPQHGTGIIERVLVDIFGSFLFEINHLFSDKVKIFSCALLVHLIITSFKHLYILILDVSNLLSFL